MADSSPNHPVETDSDVASSEVTEETSSPDSLPDDLPVVEPPSAGFILQLFMVPGLIVAAVIGVWALFGQISSSEQDWRQQIVEMRSNNEHRRWRGANGLAQMLRADIELGKDGQQLSRNPAIAKELTELLDDLLDEPASDKELISQQSFVTTTIGWLDLHDTVIPVLLDAADPKRDEIVRADAIRSLALIAGRSDEAGLKLNRTKLTDALLEYSQDRNPLLRQLCAFTLGLIDGTGVEQRLRVMAEDDDANTQVNAAIAMARRGSTDGLPVFFRVMKEAPDPVNPALMPGETLAERKAQAERQESMNAVALINVLKAIEKLYPKMETDEAAEVRKRVEPIADEFDIISIRLRAKETLRVMDESKK
ncbi:MAG: HEAT repeat domain-containing protein [Planctomycetes bacterium]|nr:HEAT repeat domain-containing protein [Planctomycetota bacterium]